MKIFLKLLMLWSISLTTLAAPDGSKLYTKFCSACHGDGGVGGVGVPLSLPAFIDNVPDDYLFATIRNGRPDRVMPAYQELSDAQISAIVKHMRAWSKKPAPVFSTEPIKGNAANGEKLFKQNCQSCHGVNAQGGKGTGVTFSRPRNLPILAPGLGNSGFLKSASDAMIKRTIMHGREGTPMQPFADKLGEAAINDLVAYVRSLEAGQPQVSHASKEPTTLVYESSESMADTLDAIKSAVIGSNFKLIRIQKFEQGYVSKGEENPDKIIVYFCSFSMLEKALQVDPRVGLFLPCRVTLLKQEDKIKMITINPAAMSESFNNAELKMMCDDLSEKYKSILEEASL